MRNDTYLATFITVAATLFAIVTSFFIAYQIYLYQKHDEFQLVVRNSLRDLNRSFFEFVQLEYYRYPTNFPRSSISTWTQIITSERVSKAQDPHIFQENLQIIKEQFDEANLEDMKRGYRGPARRALYNLVSMNLNRLIEKIVAEFPPPPGIYGIKKFESFIDENFPENQKKIDDWNKKFNLFYQEVENTNDQISYVLIQLKKVNFSEVQNLERFLETLPAPKKEQISEERFQEIISHYHQENEFFDKFFGELRELHNKTGSINDQINIYHRYGSSLNLKVNMVLVFIGMLISGIVMPFFIAINRSNSFRSSCLVRVYLPSAFLIVFIVGIVFILYEVWSK